MEYVVCAHGATSHFQSPMDTDERRPSHTSRFGRTLTGSEATKSNTTYDVLRDNSITYRKGLKDAVTDSKRRGRTWTHRTRYTVMWALCDCMQEKTTTRTDSPASVREERVKKLIWEISIIAEKMPLSPSRYVPLWLDERGDNATRQAHGALYAIRHDCFGRARQKRL